MVTSSGHEIYSTFQHDMNTDEGARSSGESSGLQSPTHFGTSFSPPGGDSFRYHDQLEVEGASAIIAPQYDYTTSLMTPQSPLLEMQVQMSGASPHTTAYPGYYTVAYPPRNQISHDYPVQHLPHSRLPSGHTGGPINSRYTTSSERRLPSEPSHDSSHSSQDRMSSLVTVNDDQKPPMPSSSEHKEPSTNAATLVVNAVIEKSVVTQQDPYVTTASDVPTCKKRPPDDSVALPPSKRKRITADRSSYHNTASPASTSRTKEDMASDRPWSSSSRLHEQSQTRSQERLQYHPASPIESRIVTAGSPSVAHDHSPTSRRHYSYASEQTPYIKSSRPQQLDVIMRSLDTQHQKLRVPTSPTVKQTQRLWWDTFMKEYPFTDTGHWLCFLHLEYFIKTLIDEEARLSIQPALIYAGLAMATLMKSSEVEFKAPGRERALWLRDTATMFIQSSINSEWIDASLAEAALIIALFESSAHPMYNPDRVEQALLTLDFIVRTTSLSTIDSGDPDVLTYPTGCVPMTDPADDSPDRKCACIPPDATQVPNPFSSWSYIPAWDPNWTDSEVHDEECRRLCWASLSLMCNYVSQCVVFNRDPPNFFLLDSANVIWYALLFPGEALDRVSPAFRSSTSSTKESVWALYCRSMLLWNFTNRLRTSTMPDDEKVELIYDAWAEAQSLQDSLRIHKCNLDTVLMYMCREYVYKIAPLTADASSSTQITITQTLRSLQGLGNGPPIFNRKQAEEWLWYQDRVIQIVISAINNLGGAQGYQLTRRPYQVTWFANQLSICLLLWNYDRSLKNALVLAKSILIPVERQLDDLRKRLIDACTTEKIERPMQSTFTLPSP
ncbi:hypothetical protein C0995_007682 [Termitomyces sp. Mi166|nr:hypothetical protein C0995_007682 [Termitomyces sp. Mi166\